jgi:hypothetical protein
MGHSVLEVNGHLHGKQIPACYGIRIYYHVRKSLDPILCHNKSVHIWQAQVCRQVTLCVDFLVIRFVNVTALRGVLQCEMCLAFVVLGYSRPNTVA